MVKIKMQNLRIGDLVKKSQWIKQEGYVVELRVVLSIIPCDGLKQVEWLRAKSGKTCTGFYKNTDMVEIVSRIQENP